MVEEKGIIGRIISTINDINERLYITIKFTYIKKKKNEVEKLDRANEVEKIDWAKLTYQTTTNFGSKNMNFYVDTTGITII